MVSSVMKTGDTGYIHRRLVAAMANLSIFFDRSVRDAAGNLLQILYGKDGFDASHLSKFELPLISMDNQQLIKQFQINNNDIESVLWQAEQTHFCQMRNQSCFSSCEQLKQHLKDEITCLFKYRDQIRATRLHYDCLKLDTNIIVPVNPFLLLRSAVVRYRKGKIVVQKEHPKTLSASLVTYMVRGTIEHMYRFYRGFYNRLWDFEASILSALSLKNVLIHYRFNYAQLEWILCEIVLRFSKALVDARELVGPLAGQMVGEMCTQTTLNSHRGPAASAGSGEASLTAEEENGSTNIIQELINYVQKPKNPQMRIYPVALSRLEEFMSPAVLEKFVFKNQKTLEEVRTLSKPQQSKIISEFIRDQLVYRSLSDVCINTPRIIQENDEDRSWLFPRLKLMTVAEQNHMLKRSPYVMRFTIDAQKCKTLNLTPYDIVRKIRAELGDDQPPETAVQLQKKVNSATEGLNEEETKCALNYNTIYDNAVAALISPTLTHKESKQEYWVLHLYISMESKYYKAAVKKETLAKSTEVIDLRKMMYVMMFKLYLNTQVNGIKGIRSARVEEEIRKVHNKETGKITSESESLVITRGTAMLQTLALPYVDNKRSISTFMVEVDEVWGIEVTANCLSRSLQRILQARNGKIDVRHLQSVVKTMCHRGFVMCFRRQGINRIHDTGTMQKAAFEETLEMFADAAASANYEGLLDPTSNAMIGKPAPVGTGATETECPQDIGPDEEVMKSHMEFQKYRTLPVYNAMDRRVMLYNSGEQQIYHSNDRFESKELGEIGGVEEQTPEEIERLMHLQQRFEMRCTSVSCQSDYVSTLKENKEEEEEDVAMSEKKQGNNQQFPGLLVKNNAVSLVESNVTGNKATKLQQQLQRSPYWQQIHHQRDAARQRMKEKIALKQVMGDHAQAMQNKKRKKVNAVKKEKKEKPKKSNAPRKPYKKKVQEKNEESINIEVDNVTTTTTYCSVPIGKAKRKLPVGFQILTPTVADSLHLKGEEFTSLVFVTNKRKKILPRIF
jgi:hypothetical protein